MTTVRAMQRRDIAPLNALYPDADADALYVQHLQPAHHVLIALDDTDTPCGYGVLQWTSDQTYLWRRNIPEVIALHGSNATQQMLLRQFEADARTQGYTHLGIQASVATPPGYDAPADNLRVTELSEASA